MRLSSGGGEVIHAGECSSGVGCCGEDIHMDTDNENEIVFHAPGEFEVPEGGFGCTMFREADTSWMEPDGGYDPDAIDDYYG